MNIYKLPLREKVIEVGKAPLNIYPNMEYVAFDNTGFRLCYEDESDVKDEDGNLKKDYIRRHLMSAESQCTFIKDEDLEDAVRKFREEYAGFKTYPNEFYDSRQNRALIIETKYKPIIEYPKCRNVLIDDGEVICDDKDPLSESVTYCSLGRGNVYGWHDGEWCPLSNDRDYWFGEYRDKIEERQVEACGFVNTFEVFSHLGRWDDKYLESE